MFNDQQVDPMSLACVEWLRAHEAFSQHTGKEVLERFERADSALLVALAVDWIGDTDKLYHAYRFLEAAENKLFSFVRTPKLLIGQKGLPHRVEIAIVRRAKTMV